MNLKYLTTLEDRFKSIFPSLYDKSYLPDPTTQNNRLITKRVVDKKTGAVTMPSFPYLMHDLGVLGTFYGARMEIFNDVTQSTEEYRTTQKHELLHAKGYDEIGVRLITGEDFPTYR